MATPLKYNSFLLCSILTLVFLASSPQPSQAVSLAVTNHAPNTQGGIRFNNEIGTDYAFKVMTDSTNFIWQTFQQNNQADRKNVDQILLIIVPSLNPGIVALTSGNQIQASAEYIQGISGDVRGDFAGVMYHEMTHVWQWNGNGQAPGGLIEGIADYVRLKAGYAPGHWVKPGGGDRWDQGYDVTAYFLDYCNSLKDGFVAQLNAMMTNGYNNGYFSDLLGKSVDELWSDYKAKYNQ